MYERNYHASVLKEDEAATKKVRSRISWKKVLFVSIVVMVAGAIVTSIFLNKLQITTVEVVGANSADPKDVSQFVMSSLDGKWLYLFPKTSIVLLPDNSLERTIQREFPKFSSVSVMRSGLQTITVTVTEYEGVYLWCNDDGGCSFMSKEGVVFASAPSFSGSAYVKIFSGGADAYPFQGISTENLSLVSLLLERLRAISIDPSEFHFTTAPSKLEVIFYHNGAPAKIIIDPDLPVDTSLEALFTALRTDKFADRFHDGTSTLDHVDLRLPNKVVYEFK